MSDLIRRQDAELILAREMYATSLEGGCDPVSPMDFLPEARAWLSDAPTIGGWIPCSERLPEAGRRRHYIITLREDYETVDRVYEAWYTESGWQLGSQMVADKDVIAWMPLPEPWNGGEEE